MGYGIQAPEYQWDDFKDADLRGKILLMMNNDPADDPELFAGKRRLYYGRWDYKYDSAARQGAAGAIIIHTTESAGYPFQVVQTSWSGEEFELEQTTGPRVQLRGWMTEDASRRIAKLAGQDLDKLRAAAERRDFRPVPLGIQLSVALPCDIRKEKNGQRSRDAPRQRPRVSSTSRHLHGTPRSPRAGGRAECRGRQNLQWGRGQRFWNGRIVDDCASVCVAIEAARPLDLICGRRG